MEFRKITETVDGEPYTLTEMDAGTALKIQEQFAGKSSQENALEWGRTILAASLRMNMSDLMAMPLTHFNRMNEILGPLALEINGFKVAEMPGEAQAGASPADSTSETLSAK